MVEKVHAGAPQIFTDEKDETTEQKTVETIELLEGYMRHFTRSRDYNVERAERLERLMQRRSARKWSAKKKQLMVRRLVNARTAVTQIDPIIDQVKVRLEQIT